MMIQKPNNWDTAVPKEAGAYERLPAGGYICYIANAEHKPSKQGKPMLVLDLDIAVGEYSSCFSGVGWYPSFYQLTDESQTEYFKAVIISIEASNPGYMWDWNPNSLMGKKIGVIFRDEEYINKKTNTIVTSSRPVFLRSISDINAGNFTVPALKKLENNQSTQTIAATNTSAFPPTAPITDDDLPFFMNQ